MKLAVSVLRQREIEALGLVNFAHNKVDQRRRELRAAEVDAVQAQAAYQARTHERERAELEEMGGGA